MFTCLLIAALSVSLVSSWAESWVRIVTVKKVQKFLGFVNFYRKFIKNFSQLVMLLTNLFKKKHEIRLVWNDERNFFETEVNFRDYSFINSIR